MDALGLRISARERRFWAVALLPKPAGADLMLSLISEDGDLSVFLNSDEGALILFEVSILASSTKVSV